MKAFFRKLRRISAMKVLSLSFLLYIAIVACSSFPQLLYETGRCLYWKTGIQELVRTINANCDELLSFDQEKMPLLDKASYINLNGLMAKTLRQTEINQRVLLKNGQLASISAESTDTDELRRAAENMARFCRMQQENGGHFLFVMAPSKISKYEDVLPAGYTDTDNDNADQLIAQLKEKDVPVLDLRESLLEEGILWEEAFFTTDHHWTPQTGFLAFREITEALSNIGATAPVNPMYTNPDNYRFHTFADTFLGSAGKRTGIYFAGMDDSIFIEPDFSTDIRLTIPELELDIRGAYQDISYHQNSGMDLEHPDPFHDNMYGLYGWGDTAISHWRNDTAGVTERILLIGDSFANIPFSLMSICYSSCDEMDMRHFHEDFSGYYQNYQPETVVILVNPNNCVSEFTCSSFLTAAE